MNQESNAPQTSPQYQLEKRQALVILLAIFFAAGWFRAIVGEESNYYPLYRLAVGLGSTIFIVR